MDGGRHTNLAGWIFLAGYLAVVGFFAFRPFRPVPGRQYPGVPLSAGGVLHPGAALEDPGASRLLWEGLSGAGRMTLDILLKTGSLEQGGPARIVSLSRDPMSRNFTLAQEGNALSFRLRTTETGGNAMLPSLLAPQVFDDRGFQHMVIVYDGARVRLHVDGALHPFEVGLRGGFGTWGRDHLFVLGDEPRGGVPWSGTIERLAIYGRALDSNEIAELHAGRSVPGVLYAFPDGAGVRPLRYRNPFVWIDPIFNPRDCAANVAAFVPLAPLLWLALPRRRKGNRWLAAFLLPTIVGAAMSASIELAQRGIDGRVPCLADLAYNTAGAALGAGLLALGLKHRRLFESMPGKETPGAVAGGEQEDGR